MKIFSNEITLDKAEDRIKKADYETAIKILEDTSLSNNLDAQLKLAQILYKEELFYNLEKSKKILSKYENDSKSFYYNYELPYYEWKYSHSRNITISYYGESSFHDALRWLIKGHKSDCYKSKLKVFEELSYYLKISKLQDFESLDNKSGEYGSPSDKEEAMQTLMLYEHNSGNEFIEFLNSLSFINEAQYLAIKGNANAQLELGKIIYYTYKKKYYYKNILNSLLKYKVITKEIDLLDEAIKWLKISGNQGNGEAFHELSNIFLDFNQPKEIQECINYLEKAANEGHLKSYIKLGLVYYDIFKNYDLAYKNFKSYINYKSDEIPKTIIEPSKLFFKISTCILKSNYNIGTRDEYLQYMARAAANGNEKAQKEILLEVKNGYLTHYEKWIDSYANKIPKTKKSFSEDEENYFIFSASLIKAESYRLGTGARQDFFLAALFYRKAKSISISKYLLGVLLEKGIKIKQDIEEGKHLKKLALEEANNKAKETIDYLSSNQDMLFDPNINLPIQMNTIKNNKYQTNKSIKQDKTTNNKGNYSNSQLTAAINLLQQHFVEDLEKNTIKDFLFQEEGEKLEFKSTRRTPYPLKIYEEVKKSKLGLKHEQDKIEFSLLKTIAAFLNCRGGKVIIGIEDNKKIVGIEYEMKINSKLATLDQYQRSLTQLINTKIINAIGLYNLDNVTHENKTLIIITVSPLKGETIAELNDIIYIRNGSESIILPARQLTAFLKSRR